MSDALGTAGDTGPKPSRLSLVARLRSAIATMDLLVGILLVVLLLPLVIVPFVVVYEFARGGAYMNAALVGILFTTGAVFAIRAVRRGDFSPGTVAVVWAVAAAILIFATYWSRHSMSGG